MNTLDQTDKLMASNIKSGFYEVLVTTDVLAKYQRLARAVLAIDAAKHERASAYNRALAERDAALAELVRE